MNKHVFELLLNCIAVGLFLSVPAGLALFLYMDNAYWLLLSALGLIVLMAG